MVGIVSSTVLGIVSAVLASDRNGTLVVSPLRASGLLRVFCAESSESDASIKSGLPSSDDFSGILVVGVTGPTSGAAGAAD